MPSVPHELLEYEVRRLPGVVAAAVDDTSVTLLVEPTANNDDLEVIVAAMLASADLERVVRVMGGTSSSGVRMGRRVAPALAGGVAGFGLLAMTATAAALHGIIPSAVVPPELPRTEAALSRVTAPPAPSPAPVHRPGRRRIVPGPFPEWAAEQEALALVVPEARPSPEIEDVEAEAARLGAARRKRPLELSNRVSPPATSPSPAPVVAVPPVVTVPPLVTVPEPTPSEPADDQDDDPTSPPSGLPEGDIDAPGFEKELDKGDAAAPAVPTSSRKPTAPAPTGLAADEVEHESRQTPPGLERNGRGHGKGHIPGHSNGKGHVHGHGHGHDARGR